MLAGVASCHVVRHGCVYGLAVFVLVDYDESERKVGRWMAKSEARERAKARLAEVVAKEHFGRLPPVGALRDVGPDGVNLAW